MEYGETSRSIVGARGMALRSGFNCFSMSKIALLYPLVIKTAVVAIRFQGPGQYSFTPQANSRPMTSASVRSSYKRLKTGNRSRQGPSEGVRSGGRPDFWEDRSVTVFTGRDARYTAHYLNVASQIIDCGAA